MDIRKRKIKGYLALSVLLIMCLVIASAMAFFTPNKNAEAITNMSTQATDLGNLLLDNYESKTDGNIFNEDVFWNLVSRISGGSVTSANRSGLSSLGSTAKSSADFRSYNNTLGNGSKDVVVTIGGKQWIATYLSSNTKGEPILTFWLATGSTTTLWGTTSNYVGAWSNQFTSNLYGTSYMRVVSLNNGGDYADTNSHMTTNVSKSLTSQWAIYTVPNTESGMNGSSLTEFIEVPNNMSWQKEQQALKYVTSSAYTGSWKYNNNNDALNYGSKVTVDGTEGATSTGDYEKQLEEKSLESYYSAWGNDTLWLPSVTETGVSGEEGIWKASNNTRSNISSSTAYYTFLRSADYTYVNALMLHYNGSALDNSRVTTNRAVRPAFHLNLAKVAKTLNSFQKPVINGEKIKYYTGSDVTFELNKINQSLVDVEVVAEYLDSNYTDVKDAVTYSCTPSYANGVMSFSVQKVGKYTVKVTPNTGYYWSDGTNTTETYTYTLKYKVTEPKFSNNTTSIEGTYNGAEQSFAISSYDTTKMNIKADGVSNLIFDASASTFRVTNAKTSYVVPVELKNKELMEWTTAGDTQDKSLTITIKKKQITKPQISGGTSKPYTGSPVNFPLSNYTAGGDVELKGPSPSTEVVTAITQTNAGTYVYTISLKDKNNTEWVGGGTADDTLTAYITSVGFAKPSLTNDGKLTLSQEKTYSTTTTPKGATFTVYNTTGVTIEPNDKTQTDAIISGNTITVTKVGTYTFKVSLADSTNTKWDDNTNDTYDLTVKVNPKDITIPVFALGADHKTYDGSAQTFELPTLDDTAIEIRNSDGNIVTAFTGKDATTYNYTLHLKDTVNTQWKDTNGGITPKNISVTIDQKVLNITSFTCSVNGNPPSWEKGKDDVTFTIVEDSLSGDMVKLLLYREQSGAKAYDLTSVDESVAKTVTVTLPDYLPQGSYVLGVELADASLYPDNGNYTLSTTNTSQYRKTFVVKGQSLILTEENMPWIYKYTDKDSIEQEVSILAQEGQAKRSVKVTYYGGEYEFTVDAEALYALGAEIDTSKGADGFAGDTKWINATTASKTITVYWKSVEGYEANSGSFELTYDIEKAKYDLTNTKWDYTGAKEYNPVQDQKVKVIDLPGGLTIADSNYRDNIKRPAGDYTAKIVGTLGNANAGNYYTPSVTDKTTYIYNKDDGEFPWTLQWKINPKSLNLTWVEKNSENNDFTYWIVSGEEAERIDIYLFYAEDDYDDLTGEATGNPIALSDITVPKKAVHYYWVVAVLKDANNYTMENKAHSFSVGSLKEMVKVKLKDEGPFVYNGSPYGQDIIVESDEGTLTSAHIDTKYYNVNDRDNPLQGAPTNAGKYVLVLALKDGLGLEEGYELTVKEIEFEIEQAEVEIALSKSEYKYNGQGKEVEFTVASNNYDVSKISVKYYKGTKDFPLGDEELPCDAGKYIVEFTLPSGESNYKIKSDSEELEFIIAKAQIVVKWVNGENNVPMLSGLDDTLKAIVGYIYYDEEGNPLEEGATLEAGKSYKVKAIFLGDNAKNYEFVSEDGQATPNESAETEKEDFTVSASNSGGNLGGVNGGDEENPTPGGDTLGELLAKIKDLPLWQLIASIISIILTLIFLSKGIGYASKKKENKRLIDSKYSAYAVAFLGISAMNWTIIACLLMGVAALAFVFMLLQKSAFKKSQRALDDAKEDYSRNKEEMMYMRMMGGQPNMNGGMGMGAQGFAYAQPMVGLGADDIRGIVADAMNNMLPNVTQYLPQEASYNDELVQQLIEQNAQNEEKIRQLTEQNQEVIHGQEILMQKLVEQSQKMVNEDVIEKLVEKLAMQQVEEKEPEKEVASAVVDDETLKELKSSLEMLARNQELLFERLSKQEAQEKPTAKEVEKKDDNAEIIKSLIEHQKSIMDKLVDKPTDKVFMPYMQQPAPQQPAEKVVERIIEKPVEKIVEKEVVKEVPVEKIVEVEKVVEKVVPMPVEKPAKATKTPAARLTLDEAYAKLSATQKKIFDTLKAYAMSKDRCKEKKSTYFTVLGQSTVNPLVKLTIKKNTTVAMFKMEDEYFKDIRKNAGSDGTKMKVKETELIVGDNQALSTAKEMIDLREDQIERYNDYLKEQKSMRKK